MKRLALPLALLVALAAVGCKGGSIAGTYKGDEGELVLKEDKTFTVTGKTKGANDGMAGKWAQEGDKGEKVVLTPETLGGKPIDEALKGIEKMASQFKANPQQMAQLKKMEDSIRRMEATLSEDKKTITITPPGSTKTLSFTKAAS